VELERNDLDWRPELSPAFPLFHGKIPLQADLIPLFGRVAEFASDSNKINHL